MKLLEKTDSEILKTLSTLIESMEQGWNENDYDKFSHNITDEFRNQVDLKEFTRQRKEACQQLGNHKLVELVNLHKNPDNIIVIWKIKFEKRNEPGLAIYHFNEKAGDLVISGSMFHA